MLFTIKDIENISGIKAHTIRIWEQRYSFLKPNRSDTNIRYYSNDELRIILAVSLLSKYGYRIAQIDKMSRQSMFENVLSLTNAEAILSITINDLLESMIDFDIERFENILNNSVIATGLEKTILEIIFPFLEKVGMLWLTNHVNPVQEKLVSNIIRQKIIAAIDTLSPVKSPVIKMCLFLPEGEFHELFLLYACYLFKKSNFNVIYLGADTAVKELKKITSVKNPDCLFTHITTAFPGKEFQLFIAALQKEFRNIHIIISGCRTLSYVKKIPPKFTFIKSISEIKDVAKRLVAE